MCATCYACNKRYSISAFDFAFDAHTDTLTSTCMRPSSQKTSNDVHEHKQFYVATHVVAIVSIASSCFSQLCGQSSVHIMKMIELVSEWWWWWCRNDTILILLTIARCNRCISERNPNWAHTKNASDWLGRWFDCRWGRRHKTKCIKSKLNCLWPIEIWFRNFISKNPKIHGVDLVELVDEENVFWFSRLNEIE